MAVAVAIATLAAASIVIVAEIVSVAVVLTRRGATGPAGGDDTGEGSGGIRRGPDAPLRPDLPGAGDPTWWPEFASDFAAYVAAGEGDESDPARSRRQRPSS